MASLLYWDPQQRAYPAIVESYQELSAFSKINAASLYLLDSVVYKLDPQGVLSMWSWLNIRFGLAIMIPLGLSWCALWAISLVTTAALVAVSALTELIIGFFKLLAYVFMAGIALLCLGLFSPQSK